MVSDASASKNTLYMCLICRQVGHIVRSCPYLSQGSRANEHSGLKLPTELETASTVAAFCNPFPVDSTSTARSLCKICKRLDILSTFTRSDPFTLDDKFPDHSNRAKKKVLRMQTFGPVLTLELLHTCPLCRFIFDITYLSVEDILDVTNPLRKPTEGQLLLVPAWTMNRIERELRWPGYAKGKGPFARCLYTAVKPASDDWSWGLSLVDWAMDAIGVVNVHRSSGPDTTTMGPRNVDPRSVDYDMLGEWLRRCDKLHHRTCRPTWSEALRNIKLVDVTTRTIVAYPTQHSDYLALSYVWGTVVQPSYTVGDMLPDVPTTIEDAMIVTQKLGKRYLWVDSLCINQSDTEEKLVQIGFMSAIYSGAWATIIAMSGTSANSGLPRVRSSIDAIPQLSYEIGGKRLVSIMPTLSRQVSQSPWVKRAWTFQEGLLSPRRLFFTNHQVYFECNSSQCCESLNDRSSPFHSLSDEQRQAFLDKVEASEMCSENVLGRGVLRDPFRPFHHGNQTDDAQEEAMLLKYMKLVYTYTSKKMTNDGDSVHAFSAILTRLQETVYKQGFLYGLPLEELPRALLWTHITESPHRRTGFPAWSWAGWEGWVKPILVKGAREVEKSKEPPLCIWTVSSNELPVLRYTFNPIESVEQEKPDSDDEGSEDWESDSEGDHHTSISDNEDPSSVDESEDDGDNVDFEDAGACEYPLDDLPSPRSSASSDSIHSVSKNDPVLELAKIMFDGDRSACPENRHTNPNTLLIDGIILQFKFKKATPQSWPDDDRQHTPTDSDPNINADSQRCLVHLRGSFREHELRFYGGNAKRVIDERHGQLQDFLLLAREHDGPQLWHSLLLLDWEGDAASRVAVASLAIDWYEPGLLASTNPQRRFFRLV